jgi:hypothetical protein
MVCTGYARLSVRKNSIPIQKLIFMVVEQPESPMGATPLISSEPMWRPIQVDGTIEQYHFGLPDLQLAKDLLPRNGFAQRQ